MRRGVYRNGCDHEKVFQNYTCLGYVEDKGRRVAAIVIWRRIAVEENRDMLVNCECM